MVQFHYLFYYGFSFVKLSTKYIMMKLKNVSINFKQRVEIEQQQTPTQSRLFTRKFIFVLVFYNYLFFITG